MNMEVWDAVAENFMTTDGTQGKLKKVLSDVVEKVSQELLEDFKKHLMDTIYAAPPGNYQRNGANGGFLAGWDIINETTLDFCVRTLRFDGSKLVAPTYENGYAHGGMGTPGEDIRDIIAMVLDSKNYNSYYSYNEGAKYLQDGNGVGYWTSYMAIVEKKLDKAFDREFKKYGIIRR